MQHGVAYVDRIGVRGLVDAFDAPALVDGDVDDHRPRAHALDHHLGHDDRRTIAGHEHRADDEVRFGDRAPVVVTEAMVEGMRTGSVIVDVAIDQGGCVEGIHETTHTDPVYVRHAVLHYAVGNIPGAVPHTSTYALTNATLPYLRDLAMKGLEDATRDDPALSAGVNVRGGAVVHPVVAEALGFS